MALYLVQHGKSLSKEKDPEKGLSEEGISDIKYVASILQEYGIQVSCIKHSGKKRARQTADIFASALAPKHHVKQSDGLNPLDDVSSFAAEIDSNENVMLVGHLPFMEKLASYLIIGSVDKPVIKFKNGGVVCLENDQNSLSWAIEWAFVPK